MNTRLIKINDLKQGDILLFSPVFTDLESKLIALITGAPVTHSAISYYNCNEIIEENVPNVQVNRIRNRIGNRTITVMRLNPHKDMTKVLDVAKMYLDDKVPYTKVQLLFSGLVILFKRTVISVEVQKLLIPLMESVVSTLIEMIDKGVYKNAHPMVCSQFVYDCYKNAGKGYRLIINNDISTKTLLHQIEDYINRNGYDMRSKLVTSIDMIDMDKGCTSIEDCNLEKLYNKLKKEIGNEEKNAEGLLDEKFVASVHELCAVINHFFGISGKGMLLTNTRKGLSSNAVTSMLGREEYFVTPGDLLNNCENLIKVGVLDNNS